MKWNENEYAYVRNFDGGLKFFCEVYLTVKVPVDGTQESIMLLDMGLSGTKAA